MQGHQRYQVVNKPPFNVSVCNLGQVPDVVCLSVHLELHEKPQADGECEYRLKYCKKHSRQFGELFHTFECGKVAIKVGRDQAADCF